MEPAPFTADESDSGAAASASRPAGTVGPLDAGTLAPLRTLIGAKIVAMAVVALVALGAGVLLAPQVAAGIGVVPRVAATVTAIDPLPAADTVAGSGCRRSQVTVGWDGARTGSFTACVAAGTGSAGAAGEAIDIAVGDSLDVWAVPGYRSVVVGSRAPNTILVLVLAAVIVIGVGGAVHYRRERRRLAALAAAPIAAPRIGVRQDGFALAFDALSLGGGRAPGQARGKRATVRLVPDGGGWRPVRLQIPGATDAAMAWRTATLHPTRQTRSGAPAGPYVIETSSGGTLLAMGRHLRAATPASLSGGER